MKKPLATLLSCIYFLANVAFAHAGESNLWKERQKNQFAALPSQLPLSNASPSDLLRQIPEISKSLEAVQSKLSKNIQADIPAAFRQLIEAVPANAGTVKEVFSGGTGKKLVLLIQDVHMDREAQENIASVLHSLSEKQGLLLPRKKFPIAVEGTTGAFDFHVFESFPDEKIRNSVASTFLHQNLISAPSYLGMTSPSALMEIVGVDDATHYRMNVEAYQSASVQKERVLHLLDSEKQALVSLKSKILNPALAKFDARLSGYQEGTLSFGDYVSALTQAHQNAGLGDMDLLLEQFMAAYGIEKSLDFNVVESQRASVIEKIAKKSSEAELHELLAESLAYRLGKIGYAAYYQAVKRLINEHGISLAAAPAFDQYIRYVLLADGIDAEKLFKSVKRTEAAVISSLCRTKAESDLMDRSQFLSLERKLVNFALTPEEWKEYSRSMDHGPSSIDRKNLSSFINFYQEADIRSRTMVDHLQSLDRPVVAMVVGGFHTPEITELLRKQGRSYAVIQPKITKIDGAAGSEYLSIFNREKTPLDKMFEGEKLFLAPSGGLAGSPEHPAVDGKMYGAMLALGAAPGADHVSTQVPGVFATTHDVPWWGHFSESFDIEGYGKVLFFVAIGGFLIWRFRRELAAVLAKVLSSVTTLQVGRAIFGKEVSEVSLRRYFAPVWEVLWFAAMVFFPPLALVFIALHFARGNTVPTVRNVSILLSAFAVVFVLPTVIAFSAVGSPYDHVSMFLLVAAPINWALHQIYNPIALWLGWPVLTTAPSESSTISMVGPDGISFEWPWQGSAKAKALLASRDKPSADEARDIDIVRKYSERTEADRYDLKDSGMAFWALIQAFSTKNGLTLNDRKKMLLFFSDNHAGDYFSLDEKDQIEVWGYLLVRLLVLEAAASEAPDKKELLDFGEAYRPIVGELFDLLEMDDSRKYFEQRLSSLAIQQPKIGRFYARLFKVWPEFQKDEFRFYEINLRSLQIETEDSSSEESFAELYRRLKPALSKKIADEAAKANKLNGQLLALRALLLPKAESNAEKAWNNPIDFLLERSAGRQFVRFDPDGYPEESTGAELVNAWKFQLAWLERMSNEQGFKMLLITNMDRYLGSVVQWLKTTKQPQSIDQLLEKAAHYLEQNDPDVVRTELEIPALPEPAEVTQGLNFLKKLWEVKHGHGMTVRLAHNNQTFDEKFIDESAAWLQAAPGEKGIILGEKTHLPSSMNVLLIVQHRTFEDYTTEKFEPSRAIPHVVKQIADSDPAHPWGEHKSVALSIKANEELFAFLKKNDSLFQGFYSSNFGDIEVITDSHFGEENNDELAPVGEESGADLALAGAGPRKGTTGGLTAFPTLRIGRLLFLPDIITRLFIAPIIEFPLFVLAMLYPPLMDMLVEWHLPSDPNVLTAAQQAEIRASVRAGITRTNNFSLLVLIFSNAIGLISTMIASPALSWQDVLLIFAIANMCWHFIENAVRIWLGKPTLTLSRLLALEDYRRLYAAAMANPLEDTPALEWFDLIEEQKGLYNGPLVVRDALRLAQGRSPIIWNRLKEALNLNSRLVLPEQLGAIENVTADSIEMSPSGRWAVAREGMRINVLPRWAGDRRISITVNGQGPINNIMFNAEENRLLVMYGLAGRQRLRIYDLETNRENKEVGNESKDLGDISDARFNFTGTRLIVRYRESDGQKKVMLINSESGRMLSDLRVRSAEFSRDSGQRWLEIQSDAGAKVRLSFFDMLLGSRIVLSKKHLRRISIPVRSERE